MKQTKGTKKVTFEKIDANDKDARKKALNTALAQLKKDYGEGTIMKLGENANMEVQAVSTGSLSLDMALCNGGVPR